MTIRNGPSAGCDPNPHPCQPSPKGLSSRPAHRPYRGLLSVHSRCGLHTRAVTNSWPAIRRLQPFRYLHDCSGCFRLEHVPGGTCTHWKAPPCHGAHPVQTFRFPTLTRVGPLPGGDNADCGAFSQPTVVKGRGALTGELPQLLI